MARVAIHVHQVLFCARCNEMFCSSDEAVLHGCAARTSELHEAMSIVTTVDEKSLGAGRLTKLWYVGRIGRGQLTRGDFAGSMGMSI